MVTFGKKVSSCVAVAVVWVGGSVCLQLIYLGVLLAILRQDETRSAEAKEMMEMWAAVGIPLIVALGGTLAVMILRASSGWPKLPMLRLFVRALNVAVFSLALVPLKNILPVAVVGGVLGIVGALTITWQYAVNSLGTHMSPGATVTQE